MLLSVTPSSFAAAAPAPWRPVVASAPTKPTKTSDESARLLTIRTMFPPCHTDDSWWRDGTARRPSAQRGHRRTRFRGSVDQRVSGQPEDEAAELVAGDRGR